MADQAVIDAGKNFINADPVLGSVIVILMVVVASLVFSIKGLLKENAEAKRAHLADVKEYAAAKEAFRSVIEAHTNTMKGQIDVLREVRSEVALLRERGRA